MLPGRARARPEQYRLWQRLLIVRARRSRCRTGCCSGARHVVKPLGRVVAWERLLQRRTHSEAVEFMKGCINLNNEDDYTEHRLG